MITVKELEEMDFDLIKGEKYNIFSKNKRKKNETIISKVIYIGQSGVDKDFLIFKSLKTNVIECFLKIDIVMGIYIIRKGVNFGKEKTG